jgi:hypothetical protein
VLGYGHVCISFDAFFFLHRTCAACPVFLATTDEAIL